MAMFFLVIQFFFLLFWFSYDYQHTAYYIVFRKEEFLIMLKLKISSLNMARRFVFPNLLLMKLDQTKQLKVNQNLNLTLQMLSLHKNLRKRSLTQFMYMTTKNCDFFPVCNFRLTCICI